MAGGEVAVVCWGERGGLRNGMDVRYCIDTGSGKSYFVAEKHDRGMINSHIDHPICCPSSAIAKH